MSSVAIAIGRVKVFGLKTNGAGTLVATLHPDEMVNLDHNTSDVSIYTFDYEKVLR